MELVYLWVEDYKNIKKQGFNFSPRFRCDYDEVTKELTINEKKDYVNIIPENINITAIVGENGSGKSSVFEILAKINLEQNKIRSSYFYITSENERLSLYSKDIKNIISIPTIKIEYSYSFDFRLKTKSEKGSNVKVNFSKYFNLNYLNISHLEQDDIIENDRPLQESKIKYYGIYSLNKFQTDSKSILPIFGEFHLDRFNYYQTYTVSQLLIEKKYKDLLFNKLKIQIPYCIKLSYSLESLKKPHMETPKELIKFLEELDNDIIKLEDSKLKDFFDLCFKSNDIEKYIKLSFKTNKYETIKFSTGQKTILFYLQKIDLMINKLDKEKTSILLFDEIELYLHPNWQKRILKLIIDFIEDNKLEKLIHIIITSHSPFILSDIPKENVIFLEEGKQVYPFDDSQQTFGANIHTLLSHGFFMKDGLMGEFAKSKIDEVINYLNNKPSAIKNDDEAQNMIDIIGEPIIKKELQRMLKNKMELSNKKEIDKIREKVDKLTQELEESTKRLKELEKKD